MDLRMGENLNLPIHNDSLSSSLKQSPYSPSSAEPGKVEVPHHEYLSCVTDSLLHSQITCEHRREFTYPCGIMTGTLCFSLVPAVLWLR